MCESILFSEHFSDLDALFPAAATDTDRHEAVLDAFERRWKDILCSEVDLKEIGRPGQPLDVLSVDFDPLLALETAIAHPLGSIRLPVLAKPWAGISRWYRNVVGHMY